MVFSSSVPALYLDAPNWQQHSNQQQQQQQQQQQFLRGNHETTHPEQQGHLLVPNNNPHALVASAGGAPTSIRPNSMAERARMEKIPPLEGPLKCPRCESTNTKFCYYNNYNLSQPRHFCKACRRYWTRGGALRNVPVGGGCRKNKRSSSSSSANKSSSLSKVPVPPPTPPPPLLSSAIGGGFMASLQNMSHLGMGLSFGGPLMNNNHNQIDDTNYGSRSNINNSINSCLLMNNHDINRYDHHHHHHQGDVFPNLLEGFEMPSAFQNMAGGGRGEDNNEKNSNITMISSTSSSSSRPNSHMFVKMEDHNNRQATAARLNLVKPLFIPTISTDHNKSTTTTATATTTDHHNQFWGNNNSNTMWNTSTTTTGHDLL